MITIRKIKRFVDTFNDEPTPLEMAEVELLEAKRRLLETMSALDYARATVSYHKARIERLTAYVEINKAQENVAETQQLVDKELNK